MRELAQLPRYRDPITRSVARLLLRSLQEQHRAPSSTVIEFEARFGQQVGLSSTHRHEFPVAVATTAVIDSLHNNLYTFESGVTRPIMAGVELALMRHGIASSSDIHDRGPRYAVDGVTLSWGSEKRLLCDTGTLVEMQHRARRAGGSGSNASSSSPVELRNPFLFQYAILMQSAWEKKRIARADVCCPGWCADLRFSVAAEVAIPIDPFEMVATPPELMRYRNRASLPVSPFFTIYLTQSLTSYDLLWHPSHSLSTFCRPSDVARLGRGTVIPTPAPFLTRHSRKRKTYARQSGLRSPATSPSHVHEIEVEVNVKAVLQAWKKAYGGAAASAYLSSAELVSTTVAGTSHDIAPSAPLRADQITDAEVRAFALAEREDPFLLRVAEEYMALLQFIGQLRTVV
ncbi:hypothetical protein ABB37_07115 [Leptomonas pyrrhocoris]|uniref:mRNA 5'-phosphatase n=1 Tax=Leptomonas pyrrhocoris TaxID=157538 RepID=A0A0N0VE24_LEPPY|nr:hypothetical protein ABB37_07115 [Leptomonas pyrrhocoris]KPA77202.1 hypothetical protein ABB37_07115 [Leptomonas pyrrhocoris]|eukprot:XP_015655641.1 hypothetical protein ABB37_07115 [Leptomonas pyrrhocoris]